MQNARALEILKELRSLEDSADIIKRKYELSIERASGYGIGGAANHDPVGEAFAKYQGQLSDIYSRYLSKASKVHKAIDAIDSAYEKEIILRRYIDSQDWEEIAGKMHYSVRHVSDRLHEKAIISFYKEYTRA